MLEQNTDQNLFSSQKIIIYKNFMILKLKIAFIKNKYDQPIEISKILLLMYAINNNNILLLIILS